MHEGRTFMLLSCSCVGKFIDIDNLEPKLPIELFYSTYKTNATTAPQIDKISASVGVVPGR